MRFYLWNLLIPLAKLQWKAISIGLKKKKNPSGFLNQSALFTDKEAEGASYFKKPKKKIGEKKLGWVAKEVSMDAAIVNVLSEVGDIFRTKEQQKTAPKNFLSFWRIG